jgi:hypothetical protein
MNKGHLLRGFVILALLSTGCSSLPGLRVLTGEEAAGGTNVEQLVESADLVMADKSGEGDPSLMAAASRIESASNSVADIIEIRHDSEADTFIINLIVPPPNFSQADLQAQFEYFDTLRRVIELSWQGALHESEGAGKLDVNVLIPQQVSTLGSGQGFVGFYLWTTAIDREDAVVYLANRPHVFNDFNDLILEGKLVFDSPQTLYDGQPNHPMFMIQNTTDQQ